MSSLGVEIQSINVQSLEISLESEDLRWNALIDRLGPLSYAFPTGTLLGGLYERSAPEWNQAQCEMPPAGTVVARCDPVADRT